MSKIKSSGLEQYGDEPFKQQQFGTAGAEGVNQNTLQRLLLTFIVIVIFCTSTEKFYDDNDDGDEGVVQVFGQVCSQEFTSGDEMLNASRRWI